MGKQTWTDDDRETPANMIYVQDESTVKQYAYMGLVKTKHHAYRSYVEVVTNGVH
jgi:hypothetical protein